MTFSLDKRKKFVIFFNNNRVNTMIKCEPNLQLFAFFNDQTLLSPARKPKGAVSNTKFKETVED